MLNESSLMTDQMIIDCVEKTGMIDPFVPEQVRTRGWQPGVYDQNPAESVISYGLSSCGYDIRLAPEFKVFSPRFDATPVIDPKEFDSHLLREHVGDDCLIPPNGYLLGRSIETFKMPDDVFGVVLGKSTYARSGIIINITPLEPGWRGALTLEIGNCCSMPAFVYANEGIAQIIFFKLPLPARSTYADRAGKYQDQVEIEPPRV